MSKNAEFQPNNLQQPRARCPKHMKMPKSVKTFGALGPWKTKEERNHYQRSMAIAIYEAEHRVKTFAKVARSAAKEEPADDAAA